MNIKDFVKDLESWALELVNSQNTIVTEDGVIEDWNKNSKANDKFLKNMKEYLKFFSEHSK